MEPQHRAPQGGLAAAGLAHHAQGLPRLDLEADSVHGVKLGVLAGAEVFRQVLHLNEGLAHGRTSSFSSYKKHFSRRPSTSRLPGRSRRQRSVAWGQRGEKEQPSGRFVGSGIMPSMG